MNTTSNTAPRTITVALRVSIDIDPVAWEQEYGVGRAEIRADVRRLIESAIRDMPVAPAAVRVI